MEGPFHPETIVSHDFASKLISSTLKRKLNDLDAEGFRARQNLQNYCIVLGRGTVIEQMENSAKRAADLGYNGLLVTLSASPEVCHSDR
jgi:hypothetical protein